MNTPIKTGFSRPEVPAFRDVSLDYLFRFLKDVEEPMHCLEGVVKVLKDSIPADNPQMKLFNEEIEILKQKLCLLKEYTGCFSRMRNLYPQEER